MAETRLSSLENYISWKYVFNLKINIYRIHFTTTIESNITDGVYDVMSNEQVRDIDDACPSCFPLLFFIHDRS